MAAPTSTTTRSELRSRPCKTKSAVVYTAAVPASDNKRSRGEAARTTASLAGIRGEARL